VSGNQLRAAALNAHALIRGNTAHQNEAKSSLPEPQSPTILCPEIQAMSLSLHVRLAHHIARITTALLARAHKAARSMQLRPIPLFRANRRIPRTDRLPHSRRARNQLAMTIAIVAIAAVSVVRPPLAASRNVDHFAEPAIDRGSSDAGWARSRGSPATGGLRAHGSPAVVRRTTYKSPTPAHASDPPKVTIVTPPAGTVATNQITVTIDYCDDTGLDLAYRFIFLDGVDVTAQFSASGVTTTCNGTHFVRRRDIGTITLPGGTSTLSANIDDIDGFTGTAVRNYTAPPRVIVTPETEHTVAPSGSGLLQHFSVTNPRVTSVTVGFSRSCSGAVTCDAAPGQQSIAAGATVTASIGYSMSGVVGAEGAIQFTASATDDAANADVGVVTVTLVPNTPAIERDQCLTVAIGRGLAYECGDLRAVHSLPSVRTRMVTRTPTLLYSSQHANPYPLIATDVQLTGGSLPDTVEATLTVNGQPQVRKWPGSAWGASGQTRRITVGFDAAGLNTGIHDYQLVVRRYDGGTPTTVKTESGMVPVVNRMSSPFGAGWWLGGLEQLAFTTQADTTLVIWVGGDGSIRRYERGGSRGDTAVFLGPAVERPDTLLRSPARNWTRIIAGGVGGARVEFAETGNHLRTITRLGDTTVFAYDQLGRLESLTVPPGSAALTYTLSYQGPGGTLSSVSAPDTSIGSPRVVSVTIDTARILRSILDPGTAQAVVFDYVSGSGRLASRTDRRGGITVVAYDEGYRLRRASTALGGTDSSTTSFCSASVRGLAACSASLVTPDSVYTILDGPRTDSADVNHFWVDVFGGVSAARDPRGYITSVVRGDRRWPALVTRVVRPNGQVVASTFDTRGNIRTVTDSSQVVGGRYSTTRYGWHARWPHVTAIVMPEGDVSTFDYDSVTGNRLWQQDGRGSTTRASFRYYTSGGANGLLRAVVAPGGARDSVSYGSTGNVSSMQDPAGTMTYVETDRLGRIRVVQSPIDTGVWKHDSTTFDARDLAVRSVSYGPALSGTSAQRVIVRAFRNAEGMPDSVQRIISPATSGSPGLDTLVTRWRYDAAGRRVAEIAADGFRDSTRYDAAGNAVEVVTRQDSIIHMTYDAFNRLVRREVPPMAYSLRIGTDEGLSARRLAADTGKMGYPRYPLDPANGSLTIPAEVQVFRYDIVGNMSAAENSDALVRRSYFLNGQLETDSLIIRPYIGNDTSLHRYGIRHRYDLNGRRVVTKHPWQLAPRVSGVVLDSVRYEYDPLAGFLTRAVDPLGNAFDFLVNARGERIRTSFPGGIFDTAAYDVRGALDRHRILNRASAGLATRHPDPVLRDDLLQRDVAGRVLVSRGVAGFRDTTEALYSGLGHAVRHAFKAPAMTNYGLPARVFSIERFEHDALGNAVWDVDTTNAYTGGAFGGFGVRNIVTGRAHEYDPLTGRELFSRELARDTEYEYDNAGNLVFSSQPGFVTNMDPVLEDRALFYSTDGKLRVSEYRRVQSNDDTPDFSWEWQGVFEEYRYDALGRRVLVRTRRDCSTSRGPLHPCKLSTIRRTVWDGMEELYEIQMPGGGDVTAGTMENDTVPVQRTPANVPDYEAYFDSNPQWGRLGYLHATGIDVPIAITRMNYEDDPVDFGSVKPHQVWAPFTIVPHWNWRGVAEYGTFADGGYKHCLPSDANRCVGVAWQKKVFAFAEEQSLGAWIGTLVENKEDQSGLVFRRNRYYDQATGRFTQEDPIGLAGGLNLYGYAGGDPVNFSDPFGLCPDPENRWCKSFAYRFLRFVGVSEATAEKWGGILYGGARRIEPGTGMAVRGVAGAVGQAAAAQASAAAALNPLNGTTYTAKVRAQIQQGDYHSFPQSVDGFAGDGTTTTIVGGDGIARTKVVLEGVMRVYDKSGNAKDVLGHFEWIINPDRTVNHRIFVPR
jgi:RHS repeat-associated protein